ncbi:hypothetical protein ACWEP4_30805 [Streptomyces sp. NPDC004227]
MPPRPVCYGLPSVSWLTVFSIHSGVHSTPACHPGSAPSYRLSAGLAPRRPKAETAAPAVGVVGAAAVRERSRILGTAITTEKAVYLQRHAHAAMLGRCVLGADSKED